jgi:parallel beta-helix repeat protein
MDRRQSKKDLPALLPWLLAMFGSLTAAAQSTIHVPANQPTIQAGIDAAQNGDTVIVSPGTYNENIDFKGKGITVMTQTGLLADASATVLNGIGGGPVANFSSGEPTTAKLTGFSIAKSTTVAISITAGSPTITNNLIAGGQGCGIVISGSQSSPTVADNEIRNLLFPVGVNCGIVLGAAVSVINGGDVSITGNSIHDIDTTPPGTSFIAGVAVESASTYSPSNIYLANNVIRNTISKAASALYANVNGSFVMVQNEIYNNTSGGGVEIMGDPVGAFHPGTSSATIVNNTVYGNKFASNATGSAIGEQAYLAGIFVSFTAKNNIFRSADTYPAVTCTIVNSSDATFANNSVSDEGGSSPPICTGVTSQNNLYSDPQFVDPANGDFHTQRTSPVIGAGDINAPNLPPADFDGKNRTVCGTIDMGVFEIHPQPPIALTVSPNPAPGQSSVSLTATVTGNCHTPTGVITFMDGNTVLGTASLNGGAVATFSTSFLFVGTHSLTAIYTGDFNFSPSTSNIITEVITGPPTTTVLSVSPNLSLPFRPITMTVTVSSAYTTPAGSITFMTGGATLATATLAANGTASAAISTLGAGTYSITAVYGGSTEYAASTSNVVLEIINGAPTTTSLISSPNPSSFGQTVTFTASVAAQQPGTTPTGTVTFMDGAASFGTETLSAAQNAQFSISSLAAGMHNITAVFNGSTNDAKSTSNLVVQVVNLDSASLSLIASVNPAQVGNPVTFTATASGIVLGATPDTVTFYDGNTAIGSTALGSAGVASITTNSLAVGTHLITAVLSATATHGAATSAPVSEVIVQPDFTFTGTPATLRSGGSGTGALQLASENGFAGAVAVTCHPPFPLNYTCTLQYPTVNLTAGLSFVSGYTIKFVYAASVAPPHPLGRPRQIALASVFPLLLLSLTGLVKKRRMASRVLLSLMLLAIVTGATTACGPDHFVAATSPGTYPITFTATGTNQGSSTPITRTLTLNVVITP